MMYGGKYKESLIPKDLNEKINGRKHTERYIKKNKKKNRYRDL